MNSNVMIPFTKAERQLATTESELDQLNSATLSDNSRDTLIAQISSGLASLKVSLRAVDSSSAVQRETDMSKRRLAIDHAKELRHRYDELCRRYAKCVPISTQISSPQSESTKAGHFRKQTSLSIENDILRSTESNLNDFISMGENTLERLKAQRLTLKGVQRRVMDSVSTLGLGRSVMKVISRRTAQDRWIFWAGIIVIFLVFYLCWRYL